MLRKETGDQHRDGQLPIPEGLENTELNRKSHLFKTWRNFKGLYIKNQGL